MSLWKVIKDLYSRLMTQHRSNIETIEITPWIFRITNRYTEMAQSNTLPHYFNEKKYRFQRVIIIQYLKKSLRVWIIIVFFFFLAINNPFARLPQCGAKR